MTTRKSNKAEDNHSTKKQQQQISTQRRSQRSTATRAIQKVIKTRARYNWKRNEMNAMLAWIFKNNDKWVKNKTKTIRFIQQNILKAHTEKSITNKLYELQHTFESCFEFVSYNHNDQVSGPVRHVIRGRALNFDFYKECRAAFGPPECDNIKFIQLRKIHGPLPSPQRQQEQQQEQDRFSILTFTSSWCVAAVVIP